MRLNPSVCTAREARQKEAVGALQRQLATSTPANRLVGKLEPAIELPVAGVFSHPCHIAVSRAVRVGLPGSTQARLRRANKTTQQSMRKRRVVRIANVASHAFRRPQARPQPSPNQSTPPPPRRNKSQLFRTSSESYCARKDDAVALGGERGHDLQAREEQL